MADEGAGDGGEGQEVLGFVFVAAAESAAAAEPGHGALDRPVVPVQPASFDFGCAASSNSLSRKPGQVWR